MPPHRRMVLLYASLVILSVLLLVFARCQVPIVLLVLLILGKEDRVGRGLLLHVSPAPHESQLHSWIVSVLSRALD